MSDETDTEYHRTSIAQSQRVAPDHISLDAARSLVCCPFCGDTDFDLIGLKSHLQHGDCEPFENTERVTRAF